MDGAHLHQQLLFGLGIVRVGHAAVDRAHRRALLLVEETHALGAFLGNDVVQVLGQRRMRFTVVGPRHPTLVDGCVRALGLTRAAVDALLGDHRGHRGLILVGVYTQPDGRLTTGAQPRTAAADDSAERTAAAATRSASSWKMRLAGWFGSATTMGSPRSPPSRMAATSGMRARIGSPKCSARRRAPPSPKTGSTVPHLGHAYPLMFSTMPSTGVLTWANIAMPRPTSSRATSCGVVTTTAPLRGTCCTRVSWASPVPGGRSTTRKSSVPQSTSRRNWRTMPITIGPRQMTGERSSRKKPIDMSRIPKRSTGRMRLSADTSGRASVPSMMGRLGPYTSASIKPTR